MNAAHDEETTEFNYHPHTTDTSRSACK